MRCTILMSPLIDRYRGPPTAPVSATPTAFACATRSIPRRRRLFIRFFFCTCRRKRKSYQKENAERKFRTLRSAHPGSATPTHTLRVCVNSHRCRWTTPPFEKGGRKLLCGGRKLHGAQKISEKKSRGAAFISCAEPRAHHHSYSHSGEVPPPLFVCFSVRRKSPCRPSFLFSRRNTAENLSRHFREHHG